MDKNILNYKDYNLLKENNSNLPLFVIDIQNIYKDAIYFDIKKFYNYLTEYKGQIIYFFNDFEEVGEYEEIVQFFIEEIGYDKDEEIVDFFDRNVTFVVKNYAFFRGSMDVISDDDIRIIYKYMVENELSDSRDINTDVLFFENEGDFEEEEDKLKSEISTGNIQEPQCGNEEFTRHGNNINTCGGGQEECLREVLILLDANNINYNEINEFIY